MFVYLYVCVFVLQLRSLQYDRCIIQILPIYYILNFVLFFEATILFQKDMIYVFLLLCKNNLFLSALIRNVLNNFSTECTLELG